MILSSKTLNTIQNKLLNSIDDKLANVSDDDAYVVFSKSIHEAGLLMLSEIRVTDDKRKDLSPWEIVQFLFNGWKVVVDYKGQYVHYYIYDPVLKTYTDSFQLLGTIVTALTFNKADMNVDVDKRTAKVHSLMTKIHGDIAYVKRKSPPTHLILLKNGIYDWKTHKFSEDVPVDYHFTKRVDASFPTNYAMFTTSQQAKLEIVNRILNDWSANNEINKLFLMEISQSVMKGDSMKKAVVLKSGGGDGKSTFMNILSKVIGEERIAPINMHKFGDDNILGQINAGTQGIFGDDLSTRTSLGGDNLSNLKSIISHQKIIINRKYLDAVALQTTALLIQATNMEINFMENTSAIADRFMMYNWPNNNFRANPIETFNLDELIEKDQEFIDMYVYYILTNCDYVTKFSNAKHFTSTTEEVVKDTDIVARFIAFAKADGYFNNYIIPTAALINLYRRFEIHERIKGEKSTAWLTRELKEPLEELGFTYSSKQVSLKTLTPLEFDVNSYMDYTGLKSADDVYNSTKRQRYFVNPAYEIKADEIDLVRKQLDRGDDIDLESNTSVVRILRYLAIFEQNSLAQSVLATN